MLNNIGMLDLDALFVRLYWHIFTLNVMNYSSGYLFRGCSRVIWKYNFTSQNVFNHALKDSGQVDH